MTNIKNLVVLGVTAVTVILGNNAFAQDDLDKLLQDLEGGDKKVEKKVEAPKSEAKAETPAEEKAVEEKPAEVTVAQEKAPEAKPAEAAAEVKTAEVKADEKAPVEVETAEEKTAEVKKVEEPKLPTEEPAVAEAKVAEKPLEAKKVAEKKPANPDDELLSNVVATEQLRRTALDAQAGREIAEARRCMENKEYTEAVRHYGLAQKLLNDRASSKNLRKECDQGIAEGLYRAALQEDDLGRREKALEFMEKALDMRHPKARRSLERWLNESKDVLEVADKSEIRHRKNDEDYKKKHDSIRKHLRRSRQLMSQNEFDSALEECEIVLKNDPYNQDAIRLRKAIQKKRAVVLQQERVASRDGMIADVDAAWRPVYAPNAAQLEETAAETVKKQAGEDPERTQEQEIEARMKAMRLPTISFKPPATIIDAVDFFRSASKDYDRPDIPIEKRGFNFVLKTPQGTLKQQPAEAEDSGDNFAAAAEENTNQGASNGLPPIPTITASDITFYEALKLVCDSVDYKFIVRGPVVMVMHKDMSTAELLSRKYDVLDAFLERMTSASSDMKEMRSAGFGGGNARAKADDEEENQEKDWKAFFEQMGVKWPEGSSIMYIKTLGKLYVRNTRENLAEFEKVLEEMGSQPKLIEIETRFVEVSQEDLNSLGFEWILNSDYSLDVNKRLGRALGIKEGVFPGGVESAQVPVKGPDGKTHWVTQNNNTFVNGYPTPTQGANWSKVNGPYGPNYQTPDGVGYTGGNRNLGINAFGGTSDYSNGNRYLSTVGNHISGESKSVNDQFMRVNAFLGSADLSMILHMLAQRSDTDLLSAPKVVTKSGENAVIKVVTEYIYPQDYDVQLQSSSSSSGGSNSGGSQSAILAVVEPQNFTMREVGVILDVTPTYSEANGGTIDLELKPQVVDEPTWKNYGMKIPFTGNSSLESFEGIGGIFTGLSEIYTAIGASIDDAIKQNMALVATDTASQAMANLSKSGADSLTYYDAPMEQPFFHVRSIDSKVSITPGATVVMGGLITEQRKAMDDKVPFLGDIPYIGRFFRSHSEWTNKRNLLIFVTGRLITPAGRELRGENPDVNPAEVTPAPQEK